MTNKIVYSLKFFSSKAMVINLFAICGYFLWVKAIEVDLLAVSLERVQRFEGKLNIC